MDSYIVILSLALIVLHQLHGVRADDESARLHEAIFLKAGSLTRPVNDPSDVTTLAFFPVIFHVDVREISKETAIVEIRGYNKYVFNAPAYSWDPEEYNGIKGIKVPVHKIWMPDWTLVNGLDAIMTENKQDLVKISHNGDVFTIPNAEYRIKCKIQKPRTYKCTLFFGSWMYGSDELICNILPEVPSALIDDEFPRDYIISDITSEKREKKYNCCPMKFAELIFTFTLTRK